ncbi:hypothetical protein [Campylobacter corcagiensis]|uniref:L-seryl-tRNA selenium transferase n=1 Tax=Campylobacter corcagiensis TaxID=1448857 RepID=A0A7M1LGC6_9BACT|nr:hypothetical protein [Campylobacter corcagiensis]QKF64158.1 putative beta-barrel assembly machinery complex lipoprotein BamB [Campylobacter corcagiensis]QOQ87647.1 hypothetical protein IMC76_02210 [Campylobacter corcagiensis]
MRNLTILTAFILAFVFTGCSTKREYFHPQENEAVADLNYQGKLNSKIAYATVNGATLKNGTIITKSGIINGVKLDKNEKFLGIFDNKILSSNISGNFKIRDMSGNVLLDKDFSSQVVSASLKGSDLAVIRADNAMFLLDISNNSVKFADKLDRVYTLDSRTASPLFLGNDALMFPSLNGQLLLIHTPTGGLALDTYISSEPFFNNVIFLENKGPNIYAATNTGVLLNTPNGNKRVIDTIKDIFLYQDRLYLFSKDGTAKVYDLALNKLNEEKFRFAQFSNIIAKGNKLYIFERQGYMIVTDLNLKNRQIFELDGDIDETNFASENVFYHGDEYIEIR